MISGHYRPMVLIVDDMAANIAILSELLQNDYRIKVAKSGKKALQIVQEVDKPDLILLDIEMPEMSGYAVCKELKNNAETSGIPVIFVTAKSDVNDEAYGLNLGAVDYISKPFHPTIVKIRVKNHIALKLKSDMLEELSMYDGLTHIPNRRYFDETYERHYKESVRDRKSLAVLMIDVDYFKLYNDHYGHGQGDACLIKIAGELAGGIKRGSDMAARYGGEEFVILLKEIDREGGISVAESLVRAVSALAIAHEYSPVADHVTISVGVGFIEDASLLNKGDLLKRADEALYHAKEKGRNQVYMYR